MDVIKHAIHGMGYWIGGVASGTVGIEPNPLGRAGAAFRLRAGGAFNEATGDTDYGLAGLDRFVDDGVGAYSYASTNLDRPQDLGASTNDHIIPQGGMALTPFPTGTTECDPVIEGAVIAYDGRFANHHPHPMIDEEAAANPGAGMDLNPGKKTRYIGDHTGKPLAVGTP